MYIARLLLQYQNYAIYAKNCVPSIILIICAEDFKGFTENERFKESLDEDVKGILSLYEASYYSIEGESLMEDACCFASEILKERVNSIDDVDLSMRVKHALELPLQWRIPRFEARWYMDIYERSGDMIPEVLKFAKLDFNILQALNQEELKDLSRYINMQTHLVSLSLLYSVSTYSLVLFLLLCFFFFWPRLLCFGT